MVLTWFDLQFPLFLNHNYLSETREILLKHEKGFDPNMHTLLSHALENCFNINGLDTYKTVK